VRAEVEGLTSEWSDGEGVRVVPGVRWHLSASEKYRADTLLEVQCALLRLSATRGDLFAVLALPEHYREEDAARHADALKPHTDSSPASLIAPLRQGETRALSYGALYHPWLIGREENEQAGWRRTPPDGAAAGILARRSLRRGAWVAPANEPLRGVVALTPSILPTSRLALQQAQVNLLRQEPQGFLALSADTLSDEDDFRPIGVRRLLILLRRMALRLGTTYVFEPNNEAFRRLVKRGFEEMLGGMFTRGAFAGATPAEAYRVVTNIELNTPQLVEQGRFIVELKVAPSLPLTFLTLRLVQTGDRGLTTEGV
jgi:phage tail sheath protein FI